MRCFAVLFSHGAGPLPRSDRGRKCSNYPESIESKEKSIARCDRSDHAWVWAKVCRRLGNRDADFELGYREDILQEEE